MKISLNSDELGEKGESRFREMCADAQLVCNKSDRDRTGWDFLVEFPVEQSTQGSFDKREIPISCHIQVKTILASTKKVSMRLTSAERLAKEPKPAFIYVFRVSSELEFIDSFMIHLSAKRLEKVLKRLRLEKAKGTKASDLNKKTISFTLNEKKEKVKLSGECLREGIKQTCKRGLAQYIDSKKERLKLIGYDKESHTGEINVEARDDKELVDFFLGLTPSLPVSQFQLNEERFGIKLPVTNVTEGEITASCTPHPTDTCIISFRESSLSTPVTSEGEIFSPPMDLVPKGNFRVLVKTDFFFLDFDASAGACSCNVKWSFDTGVGYSTKKWVELWETFKILQSGGGLIEIRPKNTGKPIRLPMRKGLKDLSVQSCNSWLSVWSDLHLLFEKACVLDSIKIPEKEALDKYLDIHYVVEFISGNFPKATFSLPSIVGISDIGNQEVAMIASLKVGSVCLAYYGIVQLQKTDLERDRWGFVSLEPKEIVQVGDPTDSFEEYVKSVQQKEQTKIFLIKRDSE